MIIGQDYAATARPIPDEDDKGKIAIRVHHLYSNHGRLGDVVGKRIIDASECTTKEQLERCAETIARQIITDHGNWLRRCDWLREISDAGIEEVRAT